MLNPYETSQIAAQHISGNGPAQYATPLIGERMRVTIRGGLALVNREQRFRNSADTSIETTITFPVPIHATLCHLSADIGGRTLLARAEPRTVARETYEQGIDEGRLSILHEELVRGVHMLSIGHIPPGADITVSHSWVMPLQPQRGSKALLRIPTTLGDVYGRSPLGDADDLITSPHVIYDAEIEVDAGDTDARVRGLAEGRTKLRLDAPVDIEITGDVWGVSRGCTADGRIVTVSVAPDSIEGADIAAAVLVDRSGSMGSAASVRGPSSRLSKHEAVKAGLAEAARALRPGDQVELWQFDHTCERVSQAEVPLARATERLGQPQGGTEIGAAIDCALAASAAREIIVVTDGLSHALDVQALANSGRRFTVVLVGDDALEANVGRLAALTGGEIFLVTGGSDPTDAVRSAIASARRQPIDFAASSWPLTQTSISIGGALVGAEWSGDKDAVEPAPFARAVGALAAAVALPRLSEEQASVVAADHGIVCHLTSLVMVDAAGEAQEGFPACRKIPLMAASGAEVGALSTPRHVGQRQPGRLYSMSSGAMEPSPGVLYSLARIGADVGKPSLAALAGRIDWAHAPEALRLGDLSQLPPDIANPVREAAKLPEVLALSVPGRGAVTVVLALMARSLGVWKWAAARFARSVLKGLEPAAVKQAEAALGL